MSRTIEIVISPDGISRVEAKGFAGKGCLAATEFIEQALGEKLSRQLKPEAHRSVKAAGKQTLGR